MTKRYLPTNLSQREIAGELYVSLETVKTHVKHLYDKLDAHGRTEAVERARAHAYSHRRHASDDGTPRSRSGS